MSDIVREGVKEYYGKTLETNADLKTTACCEPGSAPPHVREVLKDIHDEVMVKFYGCGSPIPEAVEGQRVLDLGSGSGRDCYVFSKLVGPNGFVIGVDMTDEQLEVGRKHVDYHAQKFGFDKPNVEFRKGLIEDLASADIPDNSIDIVTSNCVLNLSTEKKKVFSEIFRVLKPGGELYFSDVFSDRRIPQDVADDPVVRGECLGGALYIEDFRRQLAELGCHDYRIVESSPIEVTDPEVKAKTGNIKFYSFTVRAFKIDLEDRCEDFGQVAYYNGTISECPDQFRLDDHHIFETAKPMLVCSNTARMLQQTRFQKHFKLVGDESTHFGLFDCGPMPVTTPESTEASPGACC